MHDLPIYLIYILPRIRWKMLAYDKIYIVFLCHRSPLGVLALVRRSGRPREGSGLVLLTPNELLEL